MLDLRGPPLDVGNLRLRVQDKLFGLTHVDQRRRPAALANLGEPQRLLARGQRPGGDLELQIERAQRSLVQEAYRQTVAAFASALESKDTRTRAHSERVQRYALELARTMDSELADDPSAEYGFLLHDVGKIGIPDRVLQKPAPLTV